MFLKFQCPNEAWMIFDHIDALQYQLSPLKIESSTEIDYTYKHLIGAQIIVIAPELADNSGHAAQVAVVNFKQKNRHHVVAFSLRAFLCNESGDTVEKLQVNYKGREV